MTWSISNCNWFFLASPAPAAVAYIFFRFGSRRKKTAAAASAAAAVRRPHHPPPIASASFLTSLLLAAGTKLELYRARGCPNSEPFRTRTEAVAVDTWRTLNDMGIDHWLMFGNVLFALRRTEGIQDSDTDTDVAVPFEQLGGGDYDSDGGGRVGELIERLEAIDPARSVVYRPKGRDLVQVWYDSSGRRSGPHADIFLYRAVRDGDGDGGGGEDGTSGEYEGDETVLVNTDYTNTCQRIQKSDVFPLRPVTVLGVPVHLPRSAERIAEDEYGPSYMVPYTSRFACFENVWNGQTFYEDRAGLIVSILSAAILAALFYVPSAMLVHFCFRRAPAASSCDGADAMRMPTWAAKTESLKT